MQLRYAIGSDTGIRERNEDSVYASPHLLAVADGMGGHAHGEVASTVTIGVLAKLRPTTDPLPALATAVADTLTNLTELADRDPDLAGMGSTMTALLWTGSQFGLAHVGDSRGYLIRDDTLRQLTRDHTLVQSLVDDGSISAAEAESHPRRSMLMRTLQSGGAATPDLSTLDVQLGDRYLLCSDGLTCVVGEDLLHEALTTVPEPADAVTFLIDEAKRLHSPDNISCVVADVVTSSQNRDTVISGAAASLPTPNRRGRWTRRLRRG